MYIYIKKGMLYINTYTYTYLNPHTYILTFIYAHIISYIHTYLNTYIHTYIHTPYVHTYVCMYDVCTYVHVCINSGRHKLLQRKICRRFSLQHEVWMTRGATQTFPNFLCRGFTTYRNFSSLHPLNPLGTDTAIPA